jgi:cell division protein FtsB
MDEHRDPIRIVKEDDGKVSTSYVSAWLGAGIIALVIALALSLGYIFQQHSNSAQLASQDAAMNATVNTLQGQVDSLTSKLNQLATAPPAPAPVAVQPGTTSTGAKRRTAAENKRLKELQAKLDDQQKQLKDTQDQVAQARSDFESGISSTRSDLNGSIARTHDELVALEQKGERNYFEFDLTKAKRFQREGPISIALRKADPKHKRYDMALIVDDNQLGKKNVNLYEPVWINGSDMQQVQLVVNKVDKDHVHGYVSAPKYAQTASMTTVSARTEHTRGDASTTSATTQATTQATSETGTTDTGTTGTGTTDDSSAAAPPQQPQ